jgi:hypothetical protein
MSLEDLEGSGCGLFEILSRYFVFQGLRKAMNELSQDSQCPSQDSNRAPPEWQLVLQQNIRTFSVSYLSVRFELPFFRLLKKIIDLFNLLKF